jgi:hypothetical protein
VIVRDTIIFEKREIACDKTEKWLKLLKELCAESSHDQMLGFELELMDNTWHCWVPSTHTYAWCCWKDDKGSQKDVVSCKVCMILTWLNLTTVIWSKPAVLYSDLSAACTDMKKYWYTIFKVFEYSFFSKFKSNLNRNKIENDFPQCLKLQPKQHWIVLEDLALITQMSTALHIEKKRKQWGIFQIGMKHFSFFQII